MSEIALFGRTMKSLCRSSVLHQSNYHELWMPGMTSMGNRLRCSLIRANGVFVCRPWIFWRFPFHQKRFGSVNDKWTQKWWFIRKKGISEAALSFRWLRRKSTAGRGGSSKKFTQRRFDRLLSFATKTINKTNWLIEIRFKRLNAFDWFSVKLITDENVRVRLPIGQVNAVISVSDIGNNYSIMCAIHQKNICSKWNFPWKIHGKHCFVEWLSYRGKFE